MARIKKPAKRAPESYIQKRPRLATNKNKKIKRSDIIKSMLIRDTARKTDTSKLKPTIKRSPNNHQSNNGKQMK